MLLKDFLHYHPLVFEPHTQQKNGLEFSSRDQYNIYKTIPSHGPKMHLFSTTTMLLCVCMLLQSFLPVQPVLESKNAYPPFFPRLRANTTTLGDLALGFLTKGLQSSIVQAQYTVQCVMNKGFKTCYIQDPPFEVFNSRGATKESNSFFSTKTSKKAFYLQALGKTSSSRKKM